MIKILERELIYIWYSFGDRFVQIFWFWLAAMAAVTLAGTAELRYKRDTSGHSVPPDPQRQDRAAVFLMAQVLLGPETVILSMASGLRLFAVRMITSVLCCLTAGILIRCFCREKRFFEFNGSLNKASGNFLHNIRVYGPGFLGTLLVTTLILLYVPRTILAGFFDGEGAIEVLKGEAVSIPLNVCGAGTFLIVKEWLNRGLSIGSAAAFMIAGPAFRPSNLIAMKRILGEKKLICYIIYVAAFAFGSGIIINQLVHL